MNDDTYAAIVCLISQAEQNPNTGVSLLAARERQYRQCDSIVADGAGERASLRSSFAQTMVFEALLVSQFE